MDELTKGSWIINSGKHLLKVRANTPELINFEATAFSAKAASLLARLVASEAEDVPADRVRVFARESGIALMEIDSCLSHLQEIGKVQANRRHDGKLESVEIYSFALSDAVQAASRLYDRVGPSEYEEASLVSLDDTFRLPRHGDEILEAITASGLAEETAVQALHLQEALELLKVSDESGRKIYYNEYAFAEGADKIAKALDALNSSERQAVVDVQDMVERYPGYSLERLREKFTVRIVDMMEGVGLLDAVEVESDVGSAAFVTLPQMKGVPLGGPIISVDVFHKAKLLLSSLRFGEFKSSSGRGKIDSYEKMANIVKKLVRGEWVGPCQAIGQDYQLLERDGVVETQLAWGKTYNMKLRQVEVGKLVQQLIEFNRAVPELDLLGGAALLNQPNVYTSPEERRAQLIARSTKPVKELRDKLLQSIRTGTR